MSEVLIKDGADTSKYFGTMGAGSTGDPFFSVFADFNLEVAKGNVPGHSSVNKFGANANVGDGTTEDVWEGGGTYSYPATALMTSMSQTTDQAAMRGATIEWIGLDASWNSVTQTKTLDASDTTTVITLDTPMIRVFRGSVLADVVGDQDIRCHNAGETVDYAIISSGNNQTEMAIYTVPNGKTAYIIDYYYDGVESTGKEPKSVDFKMFIADRANSYEFHLEHSRATSKGTTSAKHNFTPYLKVTEKSDIKMSATPSGEPASVEAGFDLILVDN